jgi:hypothetical protein
MDVLASNRAKLRSVLELTRSLNQEDFPHSHSRDALLHIQSIFQDGLAALDKLSEATDQKVLQALCAAESRKIFQLFPLLGFLLRSTDTRNAFELHGPFLRIVQRVLGPDSKLVVSSEWNFSPFTFLPPSEYRLASTVMIGVPASEACNVLIVPLSGHELGHNVWLQRRKKDQVGPELATKIVEHISNVRWSEFSTCFPAVGNKNSLTDLVGQQLWRPAWQWAIRQCEEMFCDFIGMALFREAYLHAAAYLLAPGFPQRRNPEYPGSKQRAWYQQRASKMIGIQVEPGYVDRFVNEDEPAQDPHRLLLSIADAGTDAMVDRLAHEATQVIRDAGINTPDPAEITKIEKSFAKCVPPQNIAGLSEIANAGWSFFLSGMPTWRETYPDYFKPVDRSIEMLSDLVLKAMEVYEIEQRQL